MTTPQVPRAAGTLGGSLLGQALLLRAQQHWVGEQGREKSQESLHTLRFGGSLYTELPFPLESRVAMHPCCWRGLASGKQLLCKATQSSGLGYAVPCQAREPLSVNSLL